MSAAARRHATWAGPLLLGALGGSLVAARFETAAACVAAALLGARVAGASRPDRRFAGALAFGVVTALVLNAALVPGTPLVPLPAPWSGSREGLALGALLALRWCGAAVAIHGLRAAWPGERAADELAARARFLERVRVPVRTLRALTGLALRFAPLVAAEAARIAALQDHRAGGLPRTRREWVARRRALVVPLLTCTLERAERVALAMEARHYRVRPPAAIERTWAGEVAALALAAVAIAWRG